MKFLLLMLLVEYSHEQIICSGNTPFILPDESCGTFNDVCLKKGDTNCDNLQLACKQCPPTNYTILMLIDVIKGHRGIQNELNFLNYTMTVIKENVESLKKNSFSIFIICFIGLCILNILLHVENRSKLIRKLYNACGLKCLTIKSRKYELIKLKFNKNLKSFETELNGRLDKIESDIRNVRSKIESTENLKSFETKLNDRLDKIESEFRNVRSKIESTEITGYEMKFKIDKTDIALLISPDDNIVIVKRMICGKLVFSEPDDFKIMEIQFNGRSIDDNELLLKHVEHKSMELMCNINKLRNPKSIVVLRLIGNNVKRLIQIDRDKSLEDLKNIIKGLNKSNNKVFIPKSSNEFDLIDRDLTKKIKDSKIKDNDYIRVVVEKKIFLKFNSIVTNISIEKKKYSNVDKILDLKRRIREKLNCNLYIFLFEKNRILNDTQFIFEYQFNDGQILNYCQFSKCKETDFKDEQEYKRNDEYKTFRANYSIDQTKYCLMIKRYSTLTANFENEMITFNLTNEFDNKIRLKFALKSDKFYYICAKYEKSIEEILKESKEKSINENQISKWTRDILNGLNEFHDRNVSHPDLKASKIIICGKNNVAKISLFGSIENNPNYNNREILDESVNQYKEKCKELEDIKNLGEILLAIIYSECYSGDRYVNMDTFLRKRNYENRKDISQSLKQFLNYCLVDNNQQKPTVKLLLTNEFVVK